LTERSCCTATGSRRSAWLGNFFFFSFLEKRMDEKNKWIRRERERETGRFARAPGWSGFLTTKDDSGWAFLFTGNYLLGSTIERSNSCWNIQVPSLSETTARGWVLISESEIIDGCRSRLGDGSRVCQFLTKSMTLSAGEIVSRSRRFSTLTQELLDGCDGDMS
jgi:hypothetical protein